MELVSCAPGGVPQFDGTEPLTLMPAAPIMAFDRAKELVGKTIKFY